MENETDLVECVQATADVVSEEKQQVNGEELDSNYLDRGEFSSEIYKVEVKNLPKNFAFGQLRKLLVSLNLKFVKIKSPGNCTYAYVTFVSEEAREEGLKILNSAKFKGRQLEATVNFFDYYCCLFLLCLIKKKTACKSVTGSVAQTKETRVGTGKCQQNNKIRAQGDSSGR